MEVPQSTRRPNPSLLFFLAMFSDSAIYCQLPSNIIFGNALAYALSISASFAELTKSLEWSFIIQFGVECSLSVSYNSPEDHKGGKREGRIQCAVRFGRQHGSWEGLERPGDVPWL